MSKKKLRFQLRNVRDDRETRAIDERYGVVNEIRRRYEYVRP
jgi:hypothetical protein